MLIAVVILTAATAVTIRHQLHRRSTAVAHLAASAQEATPALLSVGEGLTGTLVGTFVPTDQAPPGLVLR